MRQNVRQGSYAYPRKKRLDQKTFRLSAIALLITISLLAIISPSFTANPLSNDQGDAFAQIEKKWHSANGI